MVNIKNILGFKKFLFNLKVKFAVAFHYLPKLLKGNISLGKYIIFNKRLLYFISRLQHNKFVSIGRKTRIGLYIPGFPSEAFYTACDKFMKFNAKLPDTTVLISITSACPFNCEHCYQKLDIGKDIDLDILMGVITRLQEYGVAFFNIEGGEPFMVYDRLKTVCAAIDARSEVWINSTGYGMTQERLFELKKLNLTAVMFSMHSPDPCKLNLFMQSDKAWDTMVNGINLCHESDIPVAFNICLRREDYFNGTFDKVMERARDFNAAIIQLIKPKKAGGWLCGRVDEFSNADLKIIKNLVNKYNNGRGYESYPSISAQIIEEDKMLFGCTAGGTDRFYINAKGDLQPCEFLNISFGNIGENNFDTMYNEMRDCFKKPGQCWICEKYSGEILRVFKENRLKSLPLNRDLSKKIYMSWDRGKPTELYDTIENKLK